MSESVGVFGGSFNPPHIAHVLAVTIVLSVHEIDRVLVVPTYQHPFAKQLVSYEDRVKMAELAMGWLPRVEVSRVEEDLGGESRTLRTVEHLQSKHPDWKLRLVIGADLLVEAPKWHAFDRICEIAPPIVLGRVGVDTAAGAPAPLLPAISSTDIRAKLREGRYAEVEPFLPRAVLAHVRGCRLYEAGRE